MQLLPYSVCGRKWDFQPVSSWPLSWPAFAWDRQIIAGFCDSHAYALNFQPADSDFLSIFHTCYRELSLPELGRIITQWDAPPFSWPDFLSLYRLPLDREEVSRQCQLLLATPPSFQQWVGDKKVGLRELRILSSVKNLRDLNFIFHWLSQESVSHAVGVQALELAGELLLMGYSAQQIKSSQNSSPAFVLQKMEKLRKPLSFSKDDKKKQKLKTLMWPANMNINWNRRGEHGGVEIKLWCKNQKELDCQLQAMNATAIFKRLKENPVE